MVMRSSDVRAGSRVPLAPVNRAYVRRANLIINIPGNDGNVGHVSRRDRYGCAGDTSIPGVVVRGDELTVLVVGAVGAGHLRPAARHAAEHAKSTHQLSEEGRRTTDASLPRPQADDPVPGSPRSLRPLSELCRFTFLQYANLDRIDMGIRAFVAHLGIMNLASERKHGLRVCQLCNTWRRFVIFANNAIIFT